MVQPFLQNPAKSGKVANTTGTNSQLRGEKTKTKSNINRKGPTGKLCMTGTEVQTQSTSPACSEPSWACHICFWVGCKPQELDWWFSNSPPAPSSGSLPKQNSCQAIRGYSVWSTDGDLKPTPSSFPYPPAPTSIFQRTSGTTEHSLGSSKPDRFCPIRKSWLSQLFYSRKKECLDSQDLGGEDCG